MVSGSAQSRSPLTARLALVGLATFLVAVLSIEARATYGARVTSDEPQYLLTAISLWEDLDLDISDELAEERFRPFHEVTLNPQTLELDETGRRLSPHDPLLPLMLAPAVGLWGWVGAKLMMALIGSMTAMSTVWLAVRRFGVSVNGAALVVGGAFVSPPLTSYSTQLYPEMPAALTVVAGVAAVTARRSRRADAMLVIVVTTLPWLAVKYVPVAAVLAIWRLAPILRARGLASTERLRAAAIAGLFFVAGVAYLVVHRRVYGGWTVYAAGDHFVDGELQVVGADPDYVGRSRRVVGLLVDQGFGLVPWTPSYLLVVPAIVSIARQRDRFRSVVVAVVTVGWAVATWVALTMHGWWWPGRQLVVILPIVVVAVAILVDRRGRLRSATLVGFALGLAGWLWLVVEASTGRRTLIVDFVETGNPWYQLWSSLFPNQLGYMVTGTDLVLSVGWTVGLIVGGLVVWVRTGFDSDAPSDDGTPAAPVDRAQPADTRS